MHFHRAQPCCQLASTQLASNQASYNSYVRPLWQQLTKGGTLSPWHHSQEKIQWPIDTISRRLKRHKNPVVNFGTKFRALHFYSPKISVLCKVFNAHHFLSFAQLSLISKKNEFAHSCFTVLNLSTLLLLTPYK